MLPEVTVTEALDIIETVMSAQNLYNPTTIAALHHARRALAENAELRAALARAEQTAAGARRVLTTLATASGQYRDTESRSTARENELWRALGEAETEAWLFLRSGDSQQGPGPTIMAADVPAAAGEPVCPKCGTASCPRDKEADHDWTPADVASPAVLPPTPDGDTDAGEAKRCTAACTEQHTYRRGCLLNGDSPRCSDCGCTEDWHDGPGRGCTNYRAECDCSGLAPPAAVVDPAAGDRQDVTP